MIIILYILSIIILVWFYRLPDTSTFIMNHNIIFAPCDGIVKSVNYDDRTRCHKIIVFLNILDQHHQYYPISGIIEDSEHTSGSFHPAYILEKSKYNERHSTTIRSHYGDIITVTQIAGQVARRIVNNSIRGMIVNQGQRMGMIKLSSRVDIEFSHQYYKPIVRTGDRLYALKTPIAHRLNYI